MLSFFTMSLLLLRCLDARYYVVFYRNFSHGLVMCLLSHLFSRFKEAKFRLLQSGKLHQEVDREVSR